MFLKINFTAKNIIKVFFIIILIMLFLFWQKIYNEETGIVKKVVDGDTIELESGETIRYIGMDTPEVSPPLTPIECFGPEATEYNELLLKDKNIVMKRDIKNKDKFGRLLRYVFVEDVFVNLKLVEEGYARDMQVFPNTSFARQFKQAENLAIKEKRGIWNENACNGSR